MTCGCSTSCTACGKVGTDGQRTACNCPPGECKCQGCENNVAKHSGCTCGDTCECPAGKCECGKTAEESSQAPLRTQDCQCKGECKCGTAASGTCDCGSTEKVRTSGCQCGPKCACADACDCGPGEAKASSATA